MGIEDWSYGFTVMPQSGTIDVSTPDDADDPWYMLVFYMVDGQLKLKKINSICNHDASAYISTLIIDGQEQLAISCEVCPDIKLLDFRTEKWSTAFRGQTGALCSGANNRLFAQTSGDDSIFELDCSGRVFKGPLRTMHTSMECSSMCYIPHPTNALVLSDFYSSKLVAKSAEKDEIIWEFQDKKGGMMTGLLFSAEHNVLLVPNGTNERVLIVNPQNGHLIQAIDLPDIGRIYVVSMFNDQIVMLHADKQYKISYMYLSR